MYCEHHHLSSEWKLVRFADFHLRLDLQLTYFKGQSNDGTINVSGEAKTICSAFAWADIGIMGGAWLILLVGQVYFIL